MSNKPPSLTTPPDGYSDWLTDLRHRIHHARSRIMSIQGANSAWPNVENVQQPVGLLQTPQLTGRAFRA